MKIAIDLNDVVRDYSNNFVKNYVQYYNKEYDLDGFEMYTNDLKLIMPFSSDRSYYKFVYEDMSYELFSKCPLCSRNLDVSLREFEDTTIKELDVDEPVELMFVSTMEYGNSIGCTYSFLAKLGTHVRECYFPSNSVTIWDKCDILVTANPNLLANKPEGKISVKIKTEYNNESESDYTFGTLLSFIKDNKNIEKIISGEKNINE